MIIDFSCLPDDIILLILSFCNPRDILKASCVSHRLRQLTVKHWNCVSQLNYAQFFIQYKYPTGRELNQGLNWALSKCGHNLKELSFEGYEPENNFIRVNTKTFKIIGHFCPRLELLNFSDIEMLNDHLHDLYKYIDCSNIYQLEFDRSFNHRCPIHDGLTSLYEMCPKLEILNISNSFNARARECQEPWPPNLRKLSINNARALTSYSLFSLVLAVCSHRCCFLQGWLAETQFSRELVCFSMNGAGTGMERGVELLCDGLPNMKELHLRQLPAKAETWMHLAAMKHLCILDLRDCPSICDAVMETICFNCSQLISIDVSKAMKDSSEADLTSPKFTDSALKSIASLLPDLRVLKIERRCLITDTGLAAIVFQRCLTELSVNSCALVTDTILQNLEVHCPKLSVMDMSGTHISEGGLAAFGRQWLSGRGRTAETASVETISHELYVWLYDLSFNWNTVTRRLQAMTPDNQYEFVSTNLQPRKVLTLDY